jgi:hypothetical protein
LCFSLQLGLLAGDLSDALGVPLLGGTSRFRRVGETRVVLSLLHAASLLFVTV